MLGIHNTQLPIWAKRFWTPSSIHGASLVFFFKKNFKNLAHHEILSHKLTTFMVQCTLSSHHCNKFMTASKISHSNHFENSTKFWSFVYCGEPYSYTKHLFSITCLYFSKLVHCLLTKAPLKYAIVCSMKNVTIFFWNRNEVICLGLLSSKLLTLLKLRQWNVFLAWLKVDHPKV